MNRAPRPAVCQGFATGMPDDGSPSAGALTPRSSGSCRPAVQDPRPASFASDAASAAMRFPVLDRNMKHALRLFPLLGLLAACTSDSPAPSPAAAPTVVRLGAIPDFNKGKLDETAKLLCEHLTKQTGIEVRYVPSSDYTACVNGLVANKLDLVWFGGVTSVEADAAAGGDAVFLATRDIDLKFKTYFIASKKAVESGKLTPMGSLEELKARAKDVTFTFGDKKSTSGHIMPRHFLTLAGIDAEKDFASPASYRPSGGHAATLQAVVNGEVDLGALNFTYYDKAKPEEKAAAPLVFTTPDYVDYCWVAHKRLGEATLAKLKDALLALDPAQAEDKKVLEAWSAGRFLAADSKDWDGIRSVLKALPKDFLK